MTKQSKNLSESAVQNTKDVTPETQTRPIRKKYKIFRRALCVLGLFITLILSITTGLLATETGTKWAIQLTEKMLDGFSVDEVSGKLQQGLILKKVKFATPAVNVEIAQARLEIDFTKLLQGEIYIPEISVQQPTIQVDTQLLPPSEPEDDTKSGAMSRLYLPIGVAINKIALNDLKLQIDQHKISLATFQSAVSLNNQSGLTLSPTQINDVKIETSLSATDYFKQKKREEKQEVKTAQNTSPINWTAIEHQLTPAFLGNLTKITLPFDLHIQDLQATNWRYQYEITDRNANNVKKVQSELPPDQKITLSKLQLQAEAVGYSLTLNKLQLESSLGNISGVANAQLNGEMPLNLHIQTNIETLKSGNETILPKSQADLTLSGSLKKITHLTLKSRGGINANLSAQVELNKDKMPLQVQLNSDAFQYPFSGEDPLKVKNLALNISGDLLDYQVELQGNAVGMGIPNSQVEFKGTGKLYEATLDKLQLNALGGSLNIQGNANWQEGVIWESAVDLDKINIGAFVNTFPAVLSGKLASKGLVNSKNWEINVPELDIQGNVSKQTLTLKGSFATNQATILYVPNLQLSYGNNHISAQGTLGEKSNFNLNINAPNLRGLMTDLGASLKGIATITGDIHTPNVELDLAGSGIQFQDLHLAKINAKGKINALPQLQGNLNIGLNGLKYGDSLQLNNASLTASGNEEKHELHLRSQGEPVAVNLDLSGNFDRASQIWKGVISQNHIKTPIGDIKNNQFSVNYDNNAVNAQISAHCWTNAELELCFPQAFNLGQNGDIPFDVKKLDLALINKLVNDEMFQGRLTSQGKFAWFADKPMTLDAEIKGNRLNFAQKIDYRTFRLDLAKLNLTAKLDNNNLNIKSNIDLQQGNLNTDITLQDLAQSRKLNGTLKISGVNLTLLNQLLSRGENVSGEILANLSVAGDLSAPLLNGEFQLRKLNAIINSMPFDIKDGELKLGFHGANSTLSGYIQTPESRLTLDGDASWRGVNNWKTRIHAQAQEFFLNIQSIAKLKISPDVEMKANPTALDLSGSIDIPWGRIAVESLPESAVSTSSDEVILDKKTVRRSVLMLPAKTKEGIAIKSDLRLNIGDDVTVNAYGLNSHLQGRLMVKQEKGALGLYGGINLKNGRYASFGQDLLIRKGQVSFNGLASQPMLNIEAIRNPEAMENSKITAGVKVIGIADSPEVTVFSEPSLSQDQALSYILTGRSLEDSGEAGSGGSVGAALLGMGLAKSGKVVGKIGETFGISDLNIGTAGVGDNSKVVVSGNLTKDLQIKYGVGLFNGLAEVTLRYRLLPQLFLQSVSSTDQAVDLLYQFEF